MKKTGLLAAAIAVTLLLGTAASAQDLPFSVDFNTDGTVVAPGFPDVEMANYNGGVATWTADAGGASGLAGDLALIMTKDPADQPASTPRLRPKGNGGINDWTGVQTLTFEAKANSAEAKNRLYYWVKIITQADPEITGFSGEIEVAQQLTTEWQTFTIDLPGTITTVELSSDSSVVAMDWSAVEEFAVEQRPEDDTGTVIDMTIDNIVVSTTPVSKVQDYNLY